MCLFVCSKIGAAENLGFTTYPLPYLSKEASGKNLLIGANFASGGSGYYETTAKLYVSSIIFLFFFFQNSNHGLE